MQTEKLRNSHKTVHSIVAYFTFGTDKAFINQILVLFVNKTINNPFFSLSFSIAYSDYTYSFHIATFPSPSFCKMMCKTQIFNPRY